MKKGRFRHSLLARYLLIVCLALLIWPASIPVSAIILNVIPTWIGWVDRTPTQYTTVADLEQMWHNESSALNGLSDEAIERRLRELKGTYTLASLVWVDASGKTRLALPDQPNLPSEWNIEDTVRFMKQSYGSDPLTIVALIDKQGNNGFTVFQVPRAVLDSERNMPINMEVVLWGALGVFVLFMLVSWYFFYRIRRRLVYLEEAMSESDGNGIPRPVEVLKQDEIGQLEHAFNRMIGELNEGLLREREEEELRKRLIANLSHDLRTPLTTIRGQAYSLRHEPLTESGKATLANIETKIDYVGELMDNLLSYTLLSAGKYPVKLETMDVSRTLRAFLAGWYPVFEKEGFSVDVDLPEHGPHWQLDGQLFARMMDNVLQNVVRHAKSGRYVGIRIERKDGRDALAIEDRGPGIAAQSGDKGAGIGLSIVELMAEQMGLRVAVESSAYGVTIYLVTSNLNKT